jgi:hypothetical protein
MKAASKRAPRREYCGSSAINDDAVWIESWSSSRVVAPSYKPLIVRVATRIGSTSFKPALQRCTARTILLTSTGSKVPARFFTRMRVSGIVVAAVRRANSPRVGRAAKRSPLGGPSLGHGQLDGDGRTAFAGRGQAPSGAGEAVRTPRAARCVIGQTRGRMLGAA